MNTRMVFTSGMEAPFSIEVIRVLTGNNVNKEIDINRMKEEK